MMKVKASNNMVVIDACWYDSIGIVKVLDSLTGQVKFYIKALDPNTMGTEEDDARYIAEYGSVFYYAAGIELMP